MLLAQCDNESRASLVMHPFESCSKPTKPSPLFHAYPTPRVPSCIYVFHSFTFSQNISSLHPLPPRFLFLPVRPCPRSGPEPLRQRLVRIKMNLCVSAVLQHPCAGRLSLYTCRSGPMPLSVSVSVPMPVPVSVSVQSRCLSACAQAHVCWGCHWATSRTPVKRVSFL